MRHITVTAQSEEDAAEICQKMGGFRPVEVREVESGEEGVRCFICFESKEDASAWDEKHAPK